MTIKQIFLIALTALIPQYSMADTTIEYKFSGDVLARQVCKAVANDDVNKLKHLLRSYRNSLPHGYSFNLASEGLARDFLCNDMALQEFSSNVGAQQVSRFFMNENAGLKDQVADSGK
jgi:hypothetical protein